MKRKHKIVIATGVISLSMITAMATGLINTGNLFAEDPITLSSTVFSGFQKGDKVVLGGKEFVVLDPTSGKLLSMENAGVMTEYSLINNSLKAWDDEMSLTEDGNTLIHDSSNISTYNDLQECLGDNCSFIKGLGNGSVFWTSSTGSIKTGSGDSEIVASDDTTKIAINAKGNGNETITYGSGGVLDSFECDTSSTTISDYIISSDNTTEIENETVCNLSEQWKQMYDIGAGRVGFAFWDNGGNEITGLSNCKTVYDYLKANNYVDGMVESVMSSVGETWTDTDTGHPERTYDPHGHLSGPMVGLGWINRPVNGGDSIPHPIGATLSLSSKGDECNVGKPAVSKAAVRPMVNVELKSVLFISENGTPVDANPQNSIVSLTLQDDAIEFALASDQSTTIEASNSDTIKVKYDTTDITTGSNQNIKVIVIGKDVAGNDKIIKYENLENLTSTPSGEVSIDLSSKGLNLEAGSYKLQLFNEQDNSGAADGGTSNHASAMQEISLNLAQGLEDSDVAAEGNKVTTNTDFYDGSVKYSISSTANQAILDDYSFIRIGTLAELNHSSTPTAYTSGFATYTKDGVYEKVQEVDDEGNPKVDDKGNPIYNYDDCLYVQLANTNDTSDSNFKATTMLRLDSIKIDSKKPYFPSGKNGEDKPIEIKNIIDKAPDPSPTSFFSAVFGLNGDPDPDLEEEFGGGHIKLIPNAKDFAASDYNADGTLKSTATELKGGIVSYKLDAKVLDPVTGKVDTSKAPVAQQTINVADFTDGVKPYFELQGEDAYWIELTAVDRAGREETLQRKLYMDDSVAAKPGVEVNSITKKEDGTEVKTKYEGGLLKDENGDEVANWVGTDIQIDLSLTAAELADVKSGIDYYEYASSTDIKAWLEADPTRKEEDYDGWKSLGKKKDAKGDDTKDPETVFKTDSTITHMTGEYQFRAVSRAGIAGKSSKFVINMDKQEPKLKVKAEVYDKTLSTPGYVEYSPGYKAEQGIRFTITSDGDLPVSGVKYYYRGVPTGWTPPETTARAASRPPTDKEIPWIEIKQNDSKLYQMLLTDQFQGTYYFKAENGAAVATAASNVKTVTATVGVTQPKTAISVDVKDADGNAYDGNWTSKDLTITLSGGLDGTDKAKYYEYATERTATVWKKIDKDATTGEFKLEIDSNQTINQNYYFRVVKDDPTDATLEIPYSTTQKGIKIKHDAAVPVFKADPDGVKLNPAPPAIATSFVTLTVEMTEDDPVNASPIAYYSVDDGATWIAADGKNPKKFTYDFKENTDDIKIKVKDEAGNITAYGTTLKVDNIDKTGPSAPSFPTDFVNGEWKKDPQNINITFEPSPTGAKEKIRYRVQKYDGTDFKDYDMSTSAFLDTETWLEGIEGQDTVTVALGTATEKNGEYRIIAETIDSMGRKSAKSMTTGIIRIDQEKPEVKDLKEVEDKWAASTTNFLNTLTGNKYFKDHITYTFTGADTGGSGLDKFQYQLADETAVQPDPDAWEDAYKGEVNIEKDFKGKLYIRAVDYAGNYSVPVETTDLIQVDATVPLLSVYPESLNGESYTGIDSVTVTAKDDGSGIKDGKVTYKSDYSGTEVFPNGDLPLAMDGTAVLNNLPDGNYKITFETEDESGHPVSLDYPVKIDTNTPEIEIIDNNKSGVVKEKEITIEVRDTISGRNPDEGLKVTLAGRPVTLTKTEDKGTVLTEGDVTVYKATITSNGKLEASITNNSQKNGTYASAKDEVTVSNVFNVDPQIKLEAFTGSDETKNRYTEGEWTKEHIEIVLTNTEKAIKDNELTFQYKEYDADNKPLTGDWTNTDDGDPLSTNKNGKFSVYENGVRTYEFRAVILDPTDATKDPILTSNVIKFQVMQDIQQPAAPQLDNAANYTQTKWFDSYQTLYVDFTPNTDGAGQWIEYMDKADAKPEWKRVATPGISGKYEIKVTGDKEHIIYIRSNDNFKRASAATNAIYVNIDTETPDFDVDIDYSATNATVNVLTEKKGNSIIGISGVNDITIQKKDDSGNLVVNTEQHVYGQKVILDKDNYGNGTYEIELTTNSGKKVKKDVVVDGINLPKPVITVSGNHYAVDGVSAGNAYKSGTWTRGKEIRLEVNVTNTADAGTNLTYEYQEDGENTWTQFSPDGKANVMKVSGSGKHAINIRAVNASGTTSDTYYFNVWIADDFDSTFTIQEEGKYTATDWYNRTQSVEATFPKNTTGCREWVEYSEDDGATWKHNSKNSYEVSATGKHEIKVRKNDELGSGDADTGKKIYVNIDKETIKDFKVQIDKNSFASFLNTITFGIYHNDVKQANITGDFGISQSDEIWYQIVKDPSEYVNTYAATSNDAGWQKYTAPVDLENNFKGFVYAKAKDKAGNTTNIIRTDGIVIDAVKPTIEIDDNDGNWITKKTIDVTVSDFSDDAGTIIGNASGITGIDYETRETKPIEGSEEVVNNTATIKGLHDGEYALYVVGSDKAGNKNEDTKTIKVDNTKPTLKIEGYNELGFTSRNDLVLKPTVGASGIKSLQLDAVLSDGTAVNETLTGPDYKYQATMNGTYTFTLTNNADVSVIETLNVNNITSSMDDIMGLDIKTVNLKGDEIDYLNAETLPGAEATPQWTAHDVVFKAHGSTKFKASIDDGRYTDFKADGTFTVKDEGIHTVKIKNYTDATTRTFIVKIDNKEVQGVTIVKPESGAYSAENWFNKQQVVHATFTKDDTTGIKEWLEYYDPSDDEWKKGDSVILNVDGNHTVRFRGNDELNRPTAEETAIVNLDMTAPTDLKIKIEKSLHKEFINYFFPNTYDETVEVTLHVNGDISGNERIQYQLINEEAGDTFNPLFGWETYNNTFTISDGFKGKIYARATDKAGNQTINVVTEEGIIVDTKKPEITFQETYPMTDWSSENSVKATITPTLSGLQSAWYTITKNGIITKYDIDLKDIDASNNITLENLPNGKYDIEVFAKNKAGKIGSNKFEDAMFENRAPILKVDAELEKKVSSIPVTVDVDMSSLNTTLESLTWQTSGTSAQDILTDKKFTINSNGVYKIVATTSSGVTTEKTLVVTNITNVTSVIGINAYFSEEPTKKYTGGKTWSSKDVTIEVRDTTGKVPVADLMMQMKVTDTKDGSLISDWTAMEADKNDAALYKTVASDEGSYLYEFRGSYEGVSGSTRAFQVNIDRSAPKKPLYTEDTLKKYDNAAWHSEYNAELEAAIDATNGCDEWLEYNIDGATDFEGNLLWTPTKNQKTDKIKVVDDKDHIVQIRTTDCLERHSEINEIHVKLDSTRPTNFYIKEGENLYQDFLDKLTGGNFYQKSRTVEIGGDFKIAGVDKIEYQIVKKESDFNAAGAWTKLKITDGAESGTITLLPGTKGIIYARGVDKAGNETGIIRTDLITIDNSRADLIVPDDATEWSDNTTMKIKVKDDQSGLRSVTYRSEDPSQSGEVTLSNTVDADGYREGTITNLKDGQYLVDVVATNGAGEMLTRKVRVMIDTVTPDLKVEGESSKPQTSTTLDLIPIVGGSGLDEIQQLKKEDDGTYTILKHITAVDGQKKYPYTFIENGTYYFQVVNGAGVVSTPVTEIKISNIKSDTPLIVFRTDNGYDPATWSGKPVTLEVNTNTNAKLSYRKKGDAAYTDADHVYYQNLKFDKTGIYTYEFKSVFEGVGGAADIETVEEYTVKVDLEAPKKATIENLSDYDQWFRLNKADPANPKGKIVTLIRDTSDYVNGGDITKYGDGSKETVYYHIDGDDDASGNPNWIEMDGDSVEIKKVGDNIVTFKLIDEVKGHETLSDPLHVKIYEENPTITLSSTTKPVKTMNLGIEILGALAQDDTIKKLTVERVGGDTDEIELEQGSTKYNYPISKNGNYIIRVEMEFGGKAEETLPVTNIIEEDPILTVTASDAATGTAYKFGEWAKADVKLKAVETKADPNLTIEVQSKVKGGTYGGWQPYTSGQDITIDKTGTHIYQFKTVITKGSDTYETVMDETFAVKVDKEEPGDVTINEFATYNDPNKWVSDSVNITTDFIPDLKGADEWVEYTMDGGTTWTKKNSVFITDEGTHTITFRSADELGRTHSVTNDTVYVNIDKTSAGTLSMKIGSDAAVTGKPNNITFDHFYKSSDKVVLEFTDSKGNPVTDGTIYYQFADNRNGMVDDAGAWKTYDPANPFTLTTDFRGSIYAYAVNKSGKATDVIRSNGITVDDTAPEIKKPTTDMTTWSKSSQLPVEISDGLSGIDPTTVNYQLYDDSGNAVGGKTAIHLIDGKGNIALADGEYSVEITASDKAGNAATPVRVKVMIDAAQTAFTASYAPDGTNAFGTISATVTTTPLSGIQGIYIRGNGSSWQLMDTNSPATFKVYKNGVYEVKVVNGAGKDSEIKQVNVTGIVNDLPDYTIKTTDGFEFGDFWYKELTIWVDAPDADEIYYSTNGKDGPWKTYKDKIEILETSAYQFTFKIVKDGNELITLPYDTRVIRKQADGSGTPSVVTHRNVMNYMRSVFTAFSEEPETKWLNTSSQIKFPISSSTAPGLKAGTYVQILEADENGNGIGYDENNFTLVDDDDPFYTFHYEGKYVVYQYYAYYKEGEEDKPSKPEVDHITKTYFNIDGTEPDSLNLTAEVDGSSTILNNLTGGLFFKEPLVIIPQGSDSLSGIDHYEFQSVACAGEECEVVTPKDNKWKTAESLTVPQDFEGYVYVRAADAAEPANYLEKSIKLSIKDDTTTYKILEDISDWTNTKDLNIEITPSTTGLQELNYKVFEEDKEADASRINVPATDTENKLFTIHDIPEGIYNLKVIPVENGGTSINRGVHSLKVDRTKPVVQVKLEQSNEDTASKLMNTLTLNSFYRPGLIVSASATDLAGTLEIDSQLLKIEYSLNGADWKEYTSPLKFDDEEVINVSFRAIDQAGNISEVVTQDGIAVDATAPNFEGASNNVTYWLPRTVNVKDGMSGVDTVKLNDKTAGSRVLVKDHGTSRIEAVDRSGNESTIAFTVKGLDGIKDEDINNDLINEIEKEFEEQKLGYDRELADEIQKQIDDLKNRNQDPSDPGNSGQGNQGGTNQNPNDDGTGGNGNGSGNSGSGNDGVQGDDSQTPGSGGTNGGNGSGNGTGSGSNGSGTSGTTNTGVNTGSGQSSGVMRTGTTQNTSGGIKTGDSTSIIAFLLLGLMSAMLAVAVKLKQRLNALQNR